MWTQVTNLLKLEVAEEDEDDYYSNLVDLNDWMRRQYGPMGLTCDDVTTAYNELVMERLRKADGNVLVAYPKLNARHIGEVMAAYLRQVDENVEVRQVLSQGLYLSQPEAPSQDDIDAWQEKVLAMAIEEVRAGRRYHDTGNGLYIWLYQKRRIRPSDLEFDAALELAKGQVQQELVNLKIAVGQVNNYKLDGDDIPVAMHTVNPLRNLVGKHLAGVQQESKDYKARVRQQAMRNVLLNYLCLRAGVDVDKLPDLPKVADIVGQDTGEFKPFSHSRYIESLEQQLPTMSDQAVSKLQDEARKRNQLDVYELAINEYQSRTHHTQGNGKVKRKSKKTTTPQAPADSNESESGRSE
jgi:hypothetical protein